MDRSAGQPFRRVAQVILLAGIIGAALTYWIGTRNAAVSIDALIPGTTAKIRRQNGLMYGPAMASLMELIDEYKQPEGQALIVLLGSIILSRISFGMARSRDELQADIAAKNAKPATNEGPADSSV